MLLLPLFLWWAHSPLRVATGRIRTILCIAVAFSLFCAGVFPHPSCQAEDRFQQKSPGVTAGSLDEPLATGSEESNREKRVLLREGTLVPPTEGRIMMLGRRWTFLPHWIEPPNPAATAVVPRKQIELFHTTLASMQLSRGQTIDLGSGYSQLVENRQREEIRTTLSLTSTRLVSTTTEAAPVVEENLEVKLGQVLLSENLMLQRIVKSIRIDGLDDRWTLTGEVSEFMGENRLLIRTAQRAASRE